MSYWKQYWEETKGWETLEFEFGFATYEVQEDCIYIHHAYVRPDVRDKGVGKKLMFEVSKVAKKHGKLMLRNAVDLHTFTANKNLLRYLHNGCKVWGIEHPFITLYLSIEDMEKNSKYEELK
jgi:GNAT superfamily N-acetyltransferase